MAKNKLHKGDKVMTADGRMLGTVKTLHDTCIHIQAPGRRDYWLARDAVQASTGGVTLLSLDQGALKDAAISGESHHGMHSHEKIRSSGGGVTGMLTSPMFLLLSTAILTMRKKENRDKVMSAVKQVQDKMKPAVDDMSHKANDLNSQVYDKLGDATDKAGDKLDDMGKKANDKLDDVSDKLHSQGTGGGNASGIGTQNLDAMKPPAIVAKDKVDETSWESFPASDPPGRY